MRVSDISSHAIFFEYAPMGKQQYNIINFLYIGYILIYAPIQGAVDRNLMITAFLIHAPTKDATAKSRKIDSDFTVLFKKFMQKLGIAIFTISIFLEK